MAFTVYPDAATSALLGTPINAPVPLAAGAAMGSFAPLAGHVGPDPDAFNLQTTFIRISMSGAALATPPQVELKAVNPTAVTEGPAVAIAATSIGAVQALLDGTNVTGAASAYFAGASFVNNVYLLKVVIDIAGTTLKLRITNNTGAARDFVWVVGSSGTESQKAWIHASPAALTYTALINQSAAQTAQSIQLINRGTGDLTVSGVSPAIAAPFQNTSGLPVTIAPNAAPSNVVIGFNAPATIGDTPLVNISFTSNDPAPAVGGGHNNQFRLSATTTKLEVALALDDSGSMSWGSGGEDPPIGGPDFSRWSELRSATKIFLELLGGFGENKGTFGIVKFPGKDALPVTDLTSYDFVKATSIPSAGGMSTVENLLDATDPFYKGTPMSYALQRLQSGAPPYFATDTNSINKSTRWMLVMSDGAWNDSPDPRTRIDAIAGAKIKVFSAGYGTANEVDFATLQAISTGPGTTPGGQAMQVPAGQDGAMLLANSFKSALKAGLTSISSPGDPTSILRGDNPEARHPIIITPYDTRAAFSINWNTPDAGRMVLQLITPTCDLITPENAKGGKIPGITFSGDIRHQLYIIDQSYLRNAANPAQPRHGTWRMIVTSSKLGGFEGPPDSEQYSYDVLTESSLRMDVSLDRSVYYAGDPIGVTAKLTLNGLPLTHAAVNLEVNGPGQSMDNWLAAAPVTEAEYKSAATALSKKEPSAIFIKAYAAGLKGIRFDRFSRTATLSMTEAENSGAYSASVTQTPTPDSYKLYVTAVGITPDGVVFRRERALETRVVVRPKFEFTPIDFFYDTLGENPQVLTANVRVTPKDEFENLMVIDPKTSQDLVLNARDAKVIGTFDTSFDGTYSIRMSYTRGARPSLSLVVAGTPVVQDLVIAPVDQLRYADRAVAFKLGVEGATGANKHANPKDSLGDVTRKPSGAFVSLGGYGSLTVGVEDLVIEAQGDDDVTVFVQPDHDMRSYLVEALPADKGDGWVPLGKSAGTTQSFSLRKAGLEAAAAIRITDTSGRTRGADMKPLATPGVSVRGVGFAKTASRRICFSAPWGLSLRWLIILLLLIGGLIGALIRHLFKV